MSLFISNWVLLATSLCIAAPVMLWKIKDTVSLEEDLKFSDETIEDVIPQYQMRSGGQLQHRDVVSIGSFIGVTVSVCYKATI